MNLGVDFMVKRLYDLTLIRLRGTGDGGLTPQTMPCCYILQSKLSLLPVIHN